MRVMERGCPGQILRLSRSLWLEERRQAWLLPPYPGWFGLVGKLAMLAGLFWLAVHPEVIAPIRTTPLLLGAWLLTRGILGLLSGAQEARSRLFVDPLLPLVHMSPLAPDRWLRVHLLLALPSMLSGSLWAALTLALLSPGPLTMRLLVWAPLAWLACAAVGGAARLLGMLSMLEWIMRWPRVVGAAIYLISMLQVGSGGWALFEAVHGNPVGAAYKATLLLPALLLTLPGAWLLLLHLAGRVEIGWRYHGAWLALRERAGMGGPQRSLRVPALPGAAGVVARDLISLVRNPIGRIRVWGSALLLLASPLVGHLLLGRVGGARLLLLGSLLFWVAFAMEWIGAAFTGEGPGVVLYRLAPISPLRLLWGKWVAVVLPVSLGVGLAALLAAGVAGLPLSGVLLVLGGCLGAGSLILGLAACSTRPAEARFGDQSQAAAWIGEQIPRSGGAVVGSGLAMGYLGVIFWMEGAVMPHALVIGLLLAPLAALGLGLWRLGQALRPRTVVR